MRYTTTVALKNLIIKYDTLFLKTNNFSGSGYFRVQDSNILFFDTKFFLVNKYDLNGKFINSYLGMGEGGNEIENFEFHFPLPNKVHGFFCSDYCFRLYDSNWHKISAPTMWKWAKQKKIYKDKDLSIIGKYFLNWDVSELSTFWTPVDSHGNLYMPVNVNRKNSPEINKFEDPIKFYKNAKTVGKLNPYSGKLTAVGCFYPDYYNKNPYISILSNNYIDVRNDTIYVSYEADKYIYLYTKDFTFIRAFGYEGTDMKINYLQTRSAEEYYNPEVFTKVKKSFGYYTNIFADPKSRFIFRSYTTGKPNISGLQLFNENVLEADFTVPRKFCVVGSIDNFYYADGLVNDSTLAIYRFKIIKK